MSPKTTPAGGAKPAPKSKLFSKLPKLAWLALVVIILVLVGYAVINHNNKNSAKNSASNRLVLKEFGVQVTLPSQLVGTTYTVTKPPAQFKAAPTIINLELNSYSDLADKCIPNATSKTPPYASLVKNNSSSPPSGMTVLKKFSTFYIADFGPSITKGTSCHDGSVQKSFDGMVKNLDAALKTAFSSATQI